MTLRHPHRAALCLLFPVVLALPLAGSAQARRGVRRAKPSAAALPGPSRTATNEPGPGPDSFAADLLTRTNAERIAHGLVPLRWDMRLAGLAHSWSEEMARSGFAHRDLRTIGIGTGVFADVRSLAENIAYGRGVDAGSLHDGFMNSPGHATNILDERYDSVGIGVFCDSSGQMWVTEDFAGDATAGPPAAHPDAARATPPTGGPHC